jgi:DNA-binding transcriptional MocR family regulator
VADLAWGGPALRSLPPPYHLTPELTVQDLQQGRLAPRESLPQLRGLALTLGLNYTTVVRGFAEARKRGLIVSRPGLGSFVRGSFISLPLRAGTGAEMTMNLPTEIADHPTFLRAQEQAAHSTVQASFQDLMRFQDFGGTSRYRHLTVQWVHEDMPERLLVGPGKPSAWSR